MVILPETAITEASFEKWKCFKVDVKSDDPEDGEDYWYYVIPLVEATEEDFLSLNDYYPHLFSSENGEFQDDNGNYVYSVFLFDDDLPALTTEEEVEILYKILTKKDLYN